ncbi:aminotransferase class I/II-fold pyridoxal phosphate-dependent enzyme [Dyadobacter sp. CY347]|uniref:aminotransferase class I/II-fold pyridoxal phosphate-dependent enzyme n=1 Tax=Dyadobacter sp. CY347 TaxID=2909336 RepID=UPI001F2E388F|nr:aminotransferase class I/II-fold pyridoxal phosphate-dependent enzyme [Dyadobacter sp. CY347]MCF2489556.1 aminotransferase class I/II-fold pyridoxal phosphate-dependent enzyme [Dyadobacter sp. CY347]
MKTFQTNQLPGRTVIADHGVEYLWFSGTDYLGMGHDEVFRSSIIEGFQHYGTHFGSSRNNSLRLGIYEETEIQLANWIGSESALIVSSGMWAGQMVMKMIENLVSKTTDFSSIQYHYAPKVHPALWGNAFTLSTSTWSTWAKEVVKSIHESQADTAHIICTDGIGSPLVEAFDFTLFENLPDGRSNIWIIVDESHTLGVYGNGSGLYKLINGIGKANVIMVSSLNKALGIPGGVIACDNAAYHEFRYSPWFAGASPPAPAYIYALKKLLENKHYEHVRGVLAANIAYFHNQLRSPNFFQSVPAYPVFCSQNPALYETLLSNGIMPSCFSYPSPTDLPITRLAISALHQKEDLNRLAEVCNML